jgi:uncharacterized protein YoxC
MTNAVAEQEKLIRTLYSDRSALEKYTSEICTKRAVMRDELQRKESEVESLKASIAEQDLALEELNHYYLAHAKNYDPFVDKTVDPLEAS